MTAWNGKVGGPVAPRDHGTAVQDWNMRIWDAESGGYATDAFGSAHCHVVTRLIQQ